MTNPILEQMGPMGQVRGLINALKSARNPQALLEQMAQRNPRVSEVMKAVRDNGNDPQKAFYEMAKRKGVDPQKVLEMLK